MKKIAIVGAGPTGIYTLFHLLQQGSPLSVSVYEQADEAGVGMPYSEEDNARMMLANIASIEIPPLFMTYLDWLRQQSSDYLQRYGLDKSTLHDRQFLPRILLGDYFRDRFLAVVEEARKQGFEVAVFESCPVTDVDVTPDGVALYVDGKKVTTNFDLAVLATGHIWPDDDESTRTFFPSPWSGLMQAEVAPCRVGIMGTSLSGIDAAMAVSIQHGVFDERSGDEVTFERNAASGGLKITLMSRTGILPEADFYCPIPYEPLTVMTEHAVEAETAKGSQGLLDRIFALIVGELEQSDPEWSQAISLQNLTPDTLADAWFADRKKHNPFHWAQANLAEVERNKQEKRTVPWRYTVLRLHDAVQPVVPHLNERDRERFTAGLARVFIDNYAAIPPRSIRRLLALREAGILDILALGQRYERKLSGEKTVIFAEDNSWTFDVFIDARGQKPLKTKDLPFPSLRKSLLAAGEDIPDVGEDYTLQQPESLRGRVAMAALPYLMHDKPFIQGVVESAEMGEAIANAVKQRASRLRRWLPALDD